MIKLSLIMLGIWALVFTGGTIYQIYLSNDFHKWKASRPVYGIEYINGYMRETVKYPSTEGGE